MSSLPRISGDECRKALEKAGFEFSRQKGSHMSLIKKSPFALVVVPRHAELDAGTLRSIIRHAGLSVDEFIALL